jgi:prophage DNA circulation protein
MWLTVSSAAKRALTVAVQSKDAIRDILREATGQLRNRVYVATEIASVIEQG